VEVGLIQGLFVFQWLHDIEYLMKKEYPIPSPPYFHWNAFHCSLEYEEREERNRIRRKPVEIGREKLINIVVKINDKIILKVLKITPQEIKGYLPTSYQK